MNSDSDSIREDSEAKNLSKEYVCEKLDPKFVIKLSVRGKGSQLET